MTIVIIILSAAIVTPLLAICTRSALRKKSENYEEAEAALFDLYNRYHREVTADTLDYVSRGPTDEEWLTAIKEAQPCKAGAKKSLASHCPRGGSHHPIRRILEIVSLGMTAFFYVIFFKVKPVFNARSTARGDRHPSMGPFPDAEFLLNSESSSPGADERKQLSLLQAQWAESIRRDEEFKRGLSVTCALENQEKSCQGAGSSWPLRLGTLLMAIADVVVAYTAAALLVRNHVLAIGLGSFMVLIGFGVTYILTGRWLDQVSVRTVVRVVECVLVASVTILAFGILRDTRAGILPSAGGAAIAVTVSIAALIRVEEIGLETCSSDTLESIFHAFWKSGRRSRMRSRRMRSYMRAFEPSDSSAQRAHLTLFQHACKAAVGKVVARASASLGTSAPESALYVQRGSRRKKIVCAALVIIGITAGGLFYAHVSTDSSRSSVTQQPAAFSMVPENSIEIGTAVTFDAGQTDLSRTAEDDLTQWVQLWNTSRESSVRIDGYTVIGGSYSYDLSLSRGRAETVADYLSSYGVPASRLTVTGHGEQIALWNIQDGFLKNVVFSPDAKVIVTIRSSPGKP